MHIVSLGFRCEHGASNVTRRNEGWMECEMIDPKVSKGDALRLGNAALKLPKKSRYLYVYLNARGCQKGETGQIHRW